ncbi:MAG: hypothetical protein ABI572_13040 [Actinomycetota bacterium]
MKRRVHLAVALAVTVLVAGPGVAIAAWVGAGSGSAWTKAASAPAGSAPTASVSGSNVTLSWTAARFPDSTAVNGYTVQRFDGGHVAQAVGASCSGTVNALTCTEAAVPQGTWTYAVTPKQALWTGPESADSASITVGPSLTLAPTALTTLPTTLTGNVANFITGETIIFRLDDPSTGTVLSGSVTWSPIPASGGSAVSVTVPTLTTAGAHTIYAVGSLGSQAWVAITIAPNDTVGPVVSAALVQKTTLGSAGYVKQAGTFYVYAQVTDVGSPAVGVSTVRANVTNLRTGTTAAALVAGTYTVDGVVYDYRSASITASSPLTEGSKTFTITATDLNANATTQGGFSATVDNTVPTASDFQATNTSGGTVGKAEAGDTTTYTFSEPMDPNRILASWTGNSTTVTVRIVNSSGGDLLTVRNAANTAQLPMGSVNLGRTDYVTATINFTTSSMTMSGSTIAVTLGTPSAAVGTALGIGTSVWTPSTTAWDRASNAMTATPCNETGGADAEF